MTLSNEQIRVLAIVERCASCLSLLGVVTIIVMFFYSRHFRNPTHRIIFINAFYNLFDFIATMISVSGPLRGTHSALCQFQGFCLQMFPLADVLWTLATALNVFLVVFYQYDTPSLRKLEFVYIGIITTVTFIPAFIFLFIRPAGRGPVYGDEKIWCSMSPNWVSFRIIFYYGPIWFVVGIIMILYCVVGVKIFRLRQSFRCIRKDHFTSPSTAGTALKPKSGDLGRHHNRFQNTNTKAAAVTVQVDDASQGQQSRSTHGILENNHNSNDTTSIIPPSQRNASNSLTSLIPSPTSSSEPSKLFRQYTLMPLLFFIILLITWVAPTINRVSTLIDSRYESYPLLVSVGAMGSLRGFWNGALFITAGVKGWKRQVRLDKRVFRSTP